MSIVYNGLVNLNDLKSTTYSQDGEEGIIEYLLTLIDRTHFFIEFGAADGLMCSNTAKFWQLEENHALLIEADHERYKLLKSYKSDRIKMFNAYVEELDDFTTEVADVCSIDVDGDDYYIFDRIKTRHSIMVVEYNPTIPPHIEFIGMPERPFGSSALSLTNLARRKGYELVACTESNVIFILKKYVKPEWITDLDVLFDTRWLNYVMSSYEGVYHVQKNLPWGAVGEGDLEGWQP